MVRYKRIAHAGCAMLSIATPLAARGQDAAPIAAPTPPPADPASPQTGPTSSENGGLGDIVVTATRRSESLQNVALNVVALSADSLAKAGGTNLENSLFSIPNTSTNTAAGFTAFAVRGISSNSISANVDSPIAVQSDEVYISKGFMLGLLMFDTERMEVLPGPQGTLFGRNSTGGTINLFSRRPTRQFEAGGLLQYGNYNTFRGEAYISGPLSDTLSARLSGFVVHQGDGYYRNLTLGTTEGYERKYAVRAQIAYDDGKTRLLLSGHYGKDNSTLSPYEGVGAYTPQSYAQFNPNGGGANVGLLTLCQPYLNATVTATTPGCVRGEDGLTPGDNDPYTSTNHHKHYVDNRSIGAFFRAERNLGFATLTSLSAYEGFKRRNNEIGDGSPLYFGTIINWSADIDQFTQEVRLTSNSNGHWKYVVGAFYEHDNLGIDDYLSLGTANTPAAIGFRTLMKQKVDAFALFGNSSMQVTPTLTIVAGARFNRESTVINGTTCVGSGLVNPGGNYAIGHPVTCPTTIVTSSLIVGGNQRRDSNASFKLGLEYRPKWDAFDSMLIYGTISTGFRSGGFSATLVSNQHAFTQLAPEEITDYELGFKSELAGRKLRINGGVFHYDFKNGIIKTDDPANPTIPIFVNAAAIKIWGADLSMSWLPFRSLQFNVAGGWTDATIKGNISSGGIPLDGKRPVNSPRFTFSGSADWSQPIGGGLKFIANANANWRSSQYLEVTNKPVTRENAYWLVNASLGIAQEDDRWAVTLYARNLTKTVYRNYILDITSAGWLLNIYGDPRTYGVNLKFKF